jgi:hypothetical protein
MGNREADQIKIFEAQIESMKGENLRLDEEIKTIADQCKVQHDQIEVRFLVSLSTKDN